MRAAARAYVFRFLPAVFLLALALGLSTPASAQSRDGIYRNAVTTTEQAGKADFGNVAALRRTMVDLAAALKALRFSEAEAREGGKAEPPAFAGLRPGQVAAPDVAMMRPGERSVSLSQVPDVWFAFHQDQAEAALVDLLKVLDTGKMDDQARARLAAIAFHLEAMLKPPAGLN